jgi:hypothetical protein
MRMHSMMNHFTVCSAATKKAVEDESVYWVRHECENALDDGSSERV